MLLRDAGYALRQLRRKPGFALTVIATLGLGIGATTVVYSIIDAVLLRPIPFPAPERLVTLSGLETVAGGSIRSNDTSYPNFFDWRQQSKSFQSLASYKITGYSLSSLGGAPAARVTGAMVSDSFFQTLSVGPIMGREFRREDEKPGNRSVVISHKLWQSRFGGEENVVGKSIALDEETYTIVGVMPKGFVYPLDTADVELWVTLARDAEGPNASATQRGYNQLDVIGRLRDGVSLAQARAEMNVIQSALAVRYPDDDKQLTAVDITSTAESLTGDLRRPLRILFGAVGFLLLIACVNAAGLLLTQAASRRKELSVRSALGASRVRLLGQLVTEAVALSVASGVVGIALAYAAMQVIPRFLPEGLLHGQSVALNTGVLIFTLAVSVITGLVLGVVPAWKMVRSAPALSLQDAQRGMTAGRRQHALHSGLVIGEVAISLVLLVGAGLLIRSFSRVVATDPGFDPNHLLTFRVATPEARYSDGKRVAFFNQMLERLRALPGVQSATGSFPLPLTGGDIRIGFTIEGQPVEPGNEPSERVSLTARDFFQTMHIPLKSGRFFLPSEQAAKAPAVAIVNEAFARKYFVGQNPVGRHMQSGLGTGDPPPMREIVGVVGDVKRARLTEAAQPEYYIPIEQAPVAPPAIAVRVSGDPVRYETAVRSAVASLDSALPVYRLHPYSDDLARSTGQQRFQVALLGSFAAVALMMAAIGLYALLSYVVGQRTTELGLRIALGATRSSVLGMILSRGIGLSLAGVGLGLFASTGLTRFLAGMLFHTQALDVPTLATVSLVMLGVAASACFLPAYHASRLQPVDALSRQS